MIKTDLKKFIVFGGLFLILFMVACGDDEPGEPEETPQEIAEALFTGNWSLGTITLDGTDVSNEYQGFTLTVSIGTYATTNAGELFPATGTWDWVGDSDAQITTGTGKQITLNTLTSTSLQFSFNKTDGNAVDGIPGDYVITLSK